MQSNELESLEKRLEQRIVFFQENIQKSIDALKESTDKFNESVSKTLETNSRFITDSSSKLAILTERSELARKDIDSIGNRAWAGIVAFIAFLIEIGASFISNILSKGHH